MVDDMGSRSTLDFLSLKKGHVLLCLNWLVAFYCLSFLLSLGINYFPNFFPDWLRQFSLQAVLVVACIHLFKSGWRPVNISLERTMLWSFIAGGGYLLVLVICEIVFWGRVPPSESVALEGVPLNRFILLVMIAPFFEEVFFRDLLLRALNVRLSSTVWAILLSSLFFTLAHIGFHVGALVLGLVSALLVIISRSIIPSIVLHAMANLSSFVLPTLFKNFYHWLTESNLIQYFYQ